jgi:hypothetical protein
MKFLETVFEILQQNKPRMAIKTIRGFRFTVCVLFSLRLQASASGGFPD